MSPLYLHTGPSHNTVSAPSVLQRLACLVGVNVLPCIAYIHDGLEHGVVRKYLGHERVLCDSPTPGGNPAYRLFHKVHFYGEEMETWVSQADFRQNPDYLTLFPDHASQRRLDHLNS